MDRLRATLRVLMKVIDVTPNQIRVRVEQPDAFVSGSMRTISFDEARGIGAVVGRLKGDADGKTKVQSLRFDRAKGWTAGTAERWARSHGYTPK